MSEHESNPASSPNLPVLKPGDQVTGEDLANWPVVEVARPGDDPAPESARSSPTDVDD